MATRMQQRRGTAAQWTAANPVLAAGEIGFETDTNKFKMGNGSSAWSALQYFANAAELAAIIDGAPDLLNTLNELAASLGDDPAFFTTVATNLYNHEADTTNVHGIVSTAALATTAATTSEINAAISSEVADRNTAITAHSTDTTDVHGIADTSALALTADLTTHSNDTSNVHGIADTSALALISDVTAEATARDTAITAHNTDTTDVHGIADTSALALTADLTAHSNATTTVHGIADTSALLTTSHSDATTTVHGIADTSLLATTANISDHNNETENVHGIVDTAELVTQDQLSAAVSGATVDQSALAGTGIDWDSVNEQFNIDSTVATKTYADDAVGTHNSDTTSVHGIADTSLLALKSEVEAVTKTSLGLGNVDNTADSAKPVSTAQSTAIAAAKAEAIADATSQVNALLTGAPAALNTLDELAAALGDDANFAASVTTSLGLKVDSLTPISQKTASYTLSSLTERDDLIEMGSSSALTLTIPLNSSIAYPVGTSLDILQTGTGQVTIAGAAGVTVNATPGLKLRTQWSSATLFKRAENTWVVYGDLTA